MGNNHFTSGQLVSSRYLVDKEIGRGGIAIVYSAFDNVLRQEVALKLLVPPPAASENLKHRFRREATILRELNHPNIIRVYDFIEENDSAFLVMQLIHGCDLQRFVEQEGPISARLLESYVLQIVSALDTAHQQGILHRDLKPSNILIDQNNTVYLTDFGSAKRDNQLSLITSSGFVGTLSYSAPEILEGQRADARSDIYSLGLTLYFCAKGKLPPLHRATGIVEPSEIGFLPDSMAYESIGKIIAKSTRKSPSLRFLSSSEMLSAVKNRTWDDYLSNYQTCPLCESPDLGGDGICQVCISGELKEDQLTALMIPSRINSRDKKLITKKIAETFGRNIPKNMISQVINGQKALLVLPSITAAKTAARLKELGIDVRLLPAGSAAALLPRGFQFLTLELVLVSIFAAAKSFPILGLGGVFLGIIGFLVGAKIVRQPLLANSSGKITISSRLAEIAIEIIAELRSEGLKRLWNDVVRLTSQALKLTDANDDIVLSNGINTLALSIGKAIKKLDELDSFLDTLENFGYYQTMNEEKIKNCLEDAEQMRAALQNRIFRALSMLGQTTSANFSPSLNIDLVDSAREAIEEDVNLYMEAKREVEQLVSA